MITELLESLKYVGHYFAICFLRICIGVHILNLSLTKYYNDYLNEPLLSAQVNEFLNISQNHASINFFFLELVRPYWTIFAQIQFGLEFVAGILLILGFLVRPVVILLLIYFWLFSYIQDPILLSWVSVLSVTLIGLGWAGAGRCVGLDYYFYKRYRGFLW